MRILVTFFLLGVSLSFVSCKKGEGDPAFTLKSRYKRMLGEWKLKEGITTISIKDQQALHQLYTYTFTANEFLTNVVGKGTLQGPHVLSLSMGESDDFQVKEQFGTENRIYKGHWDFLQKQGEFKNKERLMFTLQAESANPGSFASFNKALNGFTYAIEALGKKDELILRTDDELMASYKDGDIYISARYVFSH